jgi:hypothetical protein
MSDESPGGAAIDAALRELYGDVEPHHDAAALPMRGIEVEILDGTRTRVERVIG